VLLEVSFEYLRSRDVLAWGVSQRRNLKWLYSHHRISFWRKRPFVVPFYARWSQDLRYRHHSSPLEVMNHLIAKRMDQPRIQVDIEEYLVFLKFKERQLRHVTLKDMTVYYAEEPSSPSDFIGVIAKAGVRSLTMIQNMDLYDEMYVPDWEDLLCHKTFHSINLVFDHSVGADVRTEYDLMKDRKVRAELQSTISAVIPHYTTLTIEYRYRLLLGLSAKSDKVESTGTCACNVCIVCISEEGTCIFEAGGYCTYPY
jgi:hypothetical protein